MAKAKYLEFDQFPGDLLFIPTGWFHQVINLVQVSSTGVLHMFQLLQQVYHVLRQALSMIESYFEIMIMLRIVVMCESAIDVYKKISPFYT